MRPGVGLHEWRLRRAQRRRGLGLGRAVPVGLRGRRHRQVRGLGLAQVGPGREQARRRSGAVMHPVVPVQHDVVPLGQLGVVPDMRSSKHRGAPERHPHLPPDLQGVQRRQQATPVTLHRHLQPLGRPAGCVSEDPGALPQPHPAPATSQHSPCSIPAPTASHGCHRTTPKPSNSTLRASVATGGRRAWVGGSWTDRPTAGSGRGTCTSSLRLRCLPRLRRRAGARSRFHGRAWLRSGWRRTRLDIATRTTAARAASSQSLLMRKGNRSRPARQRPEPAVLQPPPIRPATSLTMAE